MKRAFLILSLLILLSACTAVPPPEAAQSPAAETGEAAPAWAAVGETAAVLYRHLNLDGDALEDEVYISDLVYPGHPFQTLTMVRIRLGSGETFLEYLPGGGERHFRTGVVMDGGREAAVIEIAAYGSNYNGADVYILRIPAEDADTPSMLRYVISDPAADLVPPGDDPVYGSIILGTEVVEVEGRSLGGLRLCLLRATEDAVKETVHITVTWDGDGWRVLPA